MDLLHGEPKRRSLGKCPMSDQITREHLKDALEPIKEDIKELVSLVKDQNTRIGAHETDIAVLKDRQPSRQAIIWGSTAGGFIATIGFILDYFGFHK